MLLIPAKDVACSAEGTEPFVLSSELPSAVTAVWTKRAAVR